LKKFAGIGKDKMLPPVPSPSPYNYRNKLVVHVDCINKKIGYTAEDNKTIIDIEKCCLLHDKINEHLARIRTRYAFDNKSEKILIRHTNKDGTISIPLSQNTEIPILTEENSYGRFSVPANSFFQVNSLLHNKLLDTFVNLLKQTKTEQLIDLYCGIGIFGIVASIIGINKVIAAEIDKPAIKAAKVNAKIHNLKNITFINGNAETLYSASITGAQLGKTTLLVDPPRSGLGNRLLNAISNNKPANIIYISCGPDTLCRDIKTLIFKFLEQNYPPQKMSQICTQTI